MIELEPLGAMGGGETQALPSPPISLSQKFIGGIQYRIDRKCLIADRRTKIFQRRSTETASSRPGRTALVKATKKLFRPESAPSGTSKW